MIATKEDIRRAAGHMILTGFPGVSANGENRELLQETRPLGVIFFAHNCQEPGQIAALNHELKESRKTPLLSSIDQEGGRVARMGPPATVWPSMRAVANHARALGLSKGAKGGKLDAAWIAQVAQAMGQELRLVNLDVNFAPVADVDTEPNNPIIGARSFSASSSEVCDAMRAFIPALQAAGVGACAKHFPGHGDTQTDSHLELPYVEADLPRLRAVEWPPFAAAIQAGVGAIMTAHVVVQACDDKPATLSRTLLQQHLRSELGFAGAIISDDLKMKAVAGRFSIKHIVVEGVQAGVDIFSIGHDPEATIEVYAALVRAWEQGDLSSAALLTAEKRALAFRQRFFKAPLPFNASDFAAQVARNTQLLADIAIHINS